MVFWSSGGRFNVGGLLDELSGVRLGIECSVGNEPSGIGKSHSCPEECSHGCRLPPGVKAASKFRGSKGPFSFAVSHI